MNYDRFGLGVLGMMHLFEVMIGEGVRRVEAGIGHYGYKKQFGADELGIRSLLVGSSARLSLLRVRLFLKLAALLHLLYYKIWFVRLSGRVAMQRPLWTTWIKSRIS